MSASLELFDRLNASALAWTRTHLAASRGTVDRFRLYEHLLAEAAVIRCDVAGAADLTDADVAGAIGNLTKFYGKFVRRHGVDNAAVFNSVSEAARAWTQDRLARRSAGAVLQGVDKIDLWDWLQARVAQACADLGLDPAVARAEQVVVRVNRFCLSMRRASRKAIIKPVTPRLNSRASRQADLAVHVEDALQGLMPGQQGPAVTVDDVHRAMPASTRVGPDGQRLRSYSRTAVARKLASLRGQPRREAAIAALRPTVRDLVWSLDHDLPASTVSVVTLAGLAGRLWPEQASKAGRCVHARRVRDALAEIPAGLGLHIETVGDVVIVGRGRRIPADRRDALLARTPRALPVGLIPSRMGVWGTQTGELVQAALQVVSGPAHEDDVDTVARALGHPNGVPAMRELAAGGRTDPRWFPVASMRPSRRRGDAKWRHDVWAWAEYVVEGSDSITADRWGTEDQEAALSILNLIAAAAESPQGPVEGTLAHLAATVPALSLASSGAPAFMVPDDGEAWRDFAGIQRLLAGATLDTWRSLVMGTVIRPGRRPATAPALPQRPIPPMPVPPPAPEPIRFSSPATLERRPLTPEAAIAIHASGYNGLSAEAAALLTAFYGSATGGTELVPVNAVMGLNRGKPCLDQRGQPVMEERSIPRRVIEVDAATEALRGFLRTWQVSSPRLHALDQETGGAVRWALKVAGIALARGEAMSVPFATYCLEATASAAVTHTAMETLVADIMTMQARFMPEPATATATA
ncbi:hypothetical protein [Methylobacterium sp. D48H]